MWLSLMLTAVLSLSPKNNIEKVFTRHSSVQMDKTLTVLSEYSRLQGARSTGVDHRMFISIGKELRSGRDFVKNAADDGVLYLGWTPLKEDNTMLQIDMPLRNDNMGINYRKIPLYFIIIEPEITNRTLSVKKIIHNPTIDIEVDIKLLKVHLLALAKESNTTLDIAPLKFYDSGRWYFEFELNLTD